MLNTELLPVKVYRSTDTGAPQLTANAGSLKTILKACLVEGYGSTPALDWAMPFEDTNKAVFKSKDPKATGIGLHIDNTAARMSLAKMFINPTGLDTADGITSRYGGTYPYLTLSDSAAGWMLVGHGRAFAFFTNRGYYGAGYSRMLWFGDFPSLVAADTGNCMLWHPENNASSANTSVLPPRTVITNNGAWATLAKSYDGLTTGTAASVNSLCAGVWSIRYPDVISNGLLASEAYIHEYIEGVNDRPLRGIWPGLWYCAHDLSNTRPFDSISGFTGSDDKFAKVCLHDLSGSLKYSNLINITAWPA